MSVVRKAIEFIIIVNVCLRARLISIGVRNRRTPCTTYGRDREQVLGQLTLMYGKFYAWRVVEDPKSKPPKSESHALNHLGQNLFFLSVHYVAPERWKGDPR